MREASAVILENSSGQVLLVMRTAEPVGWSLLGGKLEEGETKEDAAIREVREESGFKLMKAFLKYSHSDKSENGRTVHIFHYKFRGESPKDQPRPNLSGEHSAYKWVSSIDGMDLAGNAKNFFKNYKFK